MEAIINSVFNVRVFANEGESVTEEDGFHGRCTIDLENKGVKIRKYKQRKPAEPNPDIWRGEYVTCKYLKDGTRHVDLKMKKKVNLADDKVREEIYEELKTGVEKFNI